MSDTIEQLLADRAGALAAHDGVPVGVIHIHAAANQLQAEILSTRDRLIQAPAPKPVETVEEPAAPARKGRAPKAAPAGAVEGAEPATDAEQPETEAAAEEPVAEVEAPTEELAPVAEEPAPELAAAEGAPAEEVEAPAEEGPTQ